MGADLWIQSIYEEQLRKYEPKFKRVVKRRDDADTATAAYKDAEQAAILNAKWIAAAKYKRRASMYERWTKAWQAAANKYFDKMYGRGYFRDSYNMSSVLWRLNLSWWEDILSKFVTDGKIDIPHLVLFRALIRQSELIPVTERELIDNHARVDRNDPEYNVDGWNKYFVEKREKLIEFLTLAIDMNECVLTSL